MVVASVSLAMLTALRTGRQKGGRKAREKGSKSTFKLSLEHEKLEKCFSSKFGKPYTLKGFKKAPK